ncbi:3-(methylthio)propionyl-CoA ligase [Hydrogenophaga sp. SL48]|uniref:3-(methylthio)propionyl-CoA ligase n=1 Tax=Hydrogenophaga sp. SL48 TaxID=2806347 RepID=UPI001EEF02B8|nr:3-(methylthio)propionyl-CoA ligase [Hydrogenophaga sp. SL48]UJW83057.1 long-chain-fatty-acid--CoA ligase [Hydrogenophaga sp. SL48]
MYGNMMQQPLLISSLLQHAERHHRDAEIVSRRTEGGVFRYTYADLAARCRRLANVLQGLGIQQGSRVGTLAWNGYRHMELYYAVSGHGAVVHTLNPRLHPDQVVWIADHAQDEVLFFDTTFLPLVEAIADRLKTVKAFVLMTERQHMPQDSKISNLLCYEDLLENASSVYAWPGLDENSASGLCYTSGTTGNPKGVLYSHRSTILHSFAVALPDGMNCSATDTILPVVPMFHVNAWGLPYVACMVGAKLVLPGPNLDGQSLYTLFEAEGVTLAAGVPTIWQGLLTYMRENGKRFTTLRRTGIGGSACPPSMIRTFQQEYGVQVMHGWGMTETSPLVTMGVLKDKHTGQDPEKTLALQAKQGRAMFGVDIKVLGDDGNEIAWDGKTPGELMVRGNWVVSSYFLSDETATLVDGWFPTGDVATIDADGYMQITDRTKDLIKSGGEWISSIEVENIAVGHPGVAMAACIAMPDLKWAERPLLVVIRKPQMDLREDELLQFFEGKIAKWSIPDEVVFVDQIPLGATGKMLKNKLRESLATHKMRVRAK